MNPGRSVCCWSAVWLAVAVVAAAPAAGTAAQNGLSTTQYDALLVSPTNANHVFLGTQHGLFASVNGGRSWRPAGLQGASVTGLARAGSSIVASGKGLLARSNDGGKTWVRLHPKGLPNEEIGALTVNPRRTSEVYVVLATSGLYRSVDDLRSFRLVDLTVGPAIKSLAATPDSILAGGVTDGIFVSPNGKSWRRMAGGMVMSLAVNARDPSKVLAASWGVAVSSDGGHRWTTVKHSQAMFGAVAWAPGRQSLAYAVGDNNSFWRSTNGGVTWTKVDSKPS